MVMLVLDPGLTAIFGVGFASYAAVMFGYSPDKIPLVAIIVILIGGTLSLISNRIGGGTLRILTFLKVFILLFIVFCGFGSSKGDAANFQPFFAKPEDLFGALAGGVGGAFFAFAGWWEVTRMTGEIKEPRKNIPRTLIIGLSALTLIYISTSAVFIYLVPIENVTNNEAFAALAGHALFGELGGVIFAAAVCISVFGTMLAFLIVSPRVYFAMAKDGLFFRSFGEVHPRLGTPHRAVLVQVFIAIILVLSGGFEQIVGYFFFVIILFVGVAVLGLVRLRSNPTDGYQTPLYPLPMIIYSLMTVVVLIFVGMQTPLQAGIGVAVVVLGIPVYCLLFRRKYGLDKNDQV
jgi:APA family basic amino acid/polyamine antiporter